MDHYLALTNIRERIAVNKHRSPKFRMESFYLRMLNEVEGKVKYHVEVSNMFVALGDLDTGAEISTIWETI
jgi:hypothetical protein